MKTFKIYNTETWEITTVKAENPAGAKRIFKTIKNLKSFDEKVYELREHGGRKVKNYSSSSFAQYEAKEFYHRK